MIEQEKISEQAFLLLQVHDELVYEIKNELVTEVVPKIKKIMEGVIDPRDTHGIKCLAEVAVGDNWGEMKKII
jgi:DNA polymerase-1